MTTKVNGDSVDNKDIVNVLKLQLEEAQDHNTLIQEEMMKLKKQWEMLAREREEKLQVKLSFNIMK